VLRPSPPLPPPSPPPKTPSWKKQKRDGAETRIGLGKWIKVSRGYIFHVLSPNQRQHTPQDIGNSFPLFGKVIGLLVLIWSWCPMGNVFAMYVWPKW
jgi:hypothetical protein